MTIGWPQVPILGPGRGQIHTAAVLRSSVPASPTMGYTHVVTADDVRVGGEPGALLDKGLLAQDLPKFPPNGETASGLLTEAV